MERPPDPHDLLQHAGFLRALAFGLLRDAQHADDIVQESFAAALASGERREWRSWLGAVARNIASKVRRGERRREGRERRAALPEALPSAADLVAQLELQQRVVAAVSELDEPYRSMVVLRYLHGLDAAEIARREGVRPGTVRARVSRALAVLRARLDREHGGRAAWSALLLPLLPNDSAAGAALAGGIVMAANKKIVVVVALVLALGSATLLWRTARAPERPLERAEQAAALVGEGLGEPPAAAATNPARGSDDAMPRLSGIVLGPIGLPVAGARVLAYPEDSRRVVFADSEDPGVPKVVTDAAGRFAVTLADSAPGWTLHAAAEGHAPAIHEPVLPGDEVTIRLEALATLRGHVRNVGGDPVGGAAVRWLGFFGGAALVRESRSLPDGAYAIEVPPPKGAFSALPLAGGALVEVRAEGYAPLLVEADMWNAPVPDRLELDLIVVRGATVRGRVLDFDTRDPVVGARVVLWSTEGRGVFGRGRGTIGTPFTPRALAETVADADGGFVFEHVPAYGFHPLLGGPKSAGVGAAAVGYAASGVEIPGPEDGADVAAEILLCRPARVRGRVVDAEGMPAVRREVRASLLGMGSRPSLYGGAPLSVETDAQGRYETYELGAPRDGTGRARVSALGAYGVHVDVPLHAGETVDAPDLVLPEREVPRESLHVVVTDKSGAPVRDADVWTEGRAYSASTDESGQAVLPIPQGLTVTVSAQARGFARNVSPPTRVRSDGPVLVRITLEMGQRLRGRVVWEDGTPAEGALVFVLDATLPLEEARGNSQAHYGRTEARSDGLFTVIDLPAAPCHVFAIFHRAVGSEKPKASVMVASPNVSDIVIRLPGRYVPPSGALEGVVVDALTGRSPVAFRATVDELHARVCSPGRFRCERLAPGIHTVLVEAPGYASRETSVDVGDGVATLRVELERGGTVFGKVTDESGGALGSASVTLAPEGPALWRIPSARIEKDGSYRLDVVGPGIYHPVVSVPGFSSLAAKGYDPIVVRTGGEHDVSFTIVRGGELRVTVGFAARQTQEDLATLRVTLEGGGLGRGWARSTFVSAALPPGRYTLRLHFRDRVVQESTVDVKAGARSDVRLDVP